MLTETLFSTRNVLAIFAATNIKERSLSSTFSQLDWFIRMPNFWMENLQSWFFLKFESSRNAHECKRIGPAYIFCGCYELRLTNIVSWVNEYS